MIAPVPSRAGRTTALFVLGAALLPMLLRLAALPWTGFPQPAYHDEFSYLLAADTFAHGRLANPPHPLSDRFETPHVLAQPTWMSKYPPGQGLLLALGQGVFGAPWFGVWLSFGVLCGAAAWAFRGWLSQRWAVFAVVLFLVRYLPSHYWMNSYWGGALPGIGGCLCLGAYPRIRRDRRLRDGLILGLGAGLLLLTRPYEGGLLLAPLGVALLVSVWRTVGVAAGARRVVLPVALALLPACAFLGVYNHAVTGSATRLPYLVYEARYNPAPLVIWQKPRPVDPSPHEELRRLAEWNRGIHDRARSPRGLVRKVRQILGLAELRAGARNLSALLRAGFGALLLLSIPVLLGDRRMRVPLAALLVSLLGLLVSVFFFEHYAAPIAALWVLLVTRAVARARVWVWRRARSGKRVLGKRRAGTHPATWGAAVAAALLVLSTIGLATGWRFVARAPEPIQVDRPRVVAELRREPGMDLVLVRYAPDHDFLFDWVYNGGEIDAQEIVWARSSGTGRDEELLRYFAGRRAWVLRPDVTPPRLSIDLRVYRPDRRR